MMDFKEAARIPLPYALGVVVITLAFALFPALDLAISHLFYNPVTKRFLLQDNVAVQTIDFMMTMLPLAFVSACGAAFVFYLLRRRRQLPKVGWVLAYFILLFMVGPMLVVNHGLKEHWGRARPVNTVEFGGTQQFTPYYQPGVECERDCSFSSGHSARGFYFMGLAFVLLGMRQRLPDRQRAAILTTAIVFGGLAAFLRVAEGKHYASDVLFSAILITYLAWVFHRWLVQE